MDNGADQTGNPKAFPIDHDIAVMLLVAERPDQAVISRILQGALNESPVGFLSRLMPRYHGGCQFSVGKLAVKFLRRPDWRFSMLGGAVTNQRDKHMKRLLTLTTVLGLSAAPAFAGPVTGDISFNGNNSYNATTVSFTGDQNIGAGATGTLAALGTCTGCVTALNLTWNPYSGSLTNFLHVTNNGVTLQIDLGAMTSAPVFNPGTDLDLTFAAVLHETGFANTPGNLQFSTQGPNDVAVTFSATAEATAPEPASLAILGVGLVGLAAVGRRRA